MGDCRDPRWIASADATGPKLTPIAGGACYEYTQGPNEAPCLPETVCEIGPPTFYEWPE